MSNDNPPSASGGGGSPVHPVFVPVAAGFFVGALLTDLFYLKTAQVQWETFSIWLLTIGLMVAGLAGLAALFDLIGRRRAFRPSWPPLLVGLIAALLSLVNAFVHSRDGYTAVVPTGVELSAVVGLMVLYLGWNRWNLSLPNRTASVR